jgi:hypothetical protein
LDPSERQRSATRAAFCRIKNAAYGELAVESGRIVVDERSTALEVKHSCNGIEIDGVTDPAGRSCNNISFEIQVSNSLICCLTVNWLDPKLGSVNVTLRLPKFI